MINPPLVLKYDEAYPLDALEAEVRAMPLDDDEDLLAFIPLASRLAALGRPDCLAQAVKACEAVKPCLWSLILRRVQEGRWELENALGEDLAHAVIAAQDWWLFRKLADSELVKNPTVDAPLHVWGREADRTPLDADACYTLERWLVRFPIPKELRLVTVHAPMTWWERKLVRMMVDAAMRKNT